MSDSLSYTMRSGHEESSDTIGTNGLGAAIFCFAAMTAPERRSRPATTAMAVQAVAVASVDRQISLVGWRQRVGETLIALGESLCGRAGSLDKQLAAE